MTERPAPPIPAACAHRPITPDGLVVPWANVVLSDGGCDFRSHHNARWLACWERGLCQVCGRPLTRPTLFLCGPRQLQQLLFDEPPLHPECARYTAWACPMVGGRQDRYRTGEPVAHRARGGTCPDPGCDCAGWVPTPGTQAGPGGGPAHPWYAVYVTDYHLAANPDRRLIGGACHPEQVLRVRLVSEPGNPRRPWPTVADWRDRYRAPQVAEGAPEATR